MPHEQHRIRISSKTGQSWALILAGGEGSRLQSLTTTASGVAIPKQFCSFGGEASLLHDALRRAQTVTTPARTCVVVSEHHRLWWQAMDLRIPSANVIRQPSNRGTAIGILLPLLQILHRDPNATLLVLPSDHFVCDEAVLAESLQAAVREIRRQPDRIVMLGISPDEADPELGYIVSRTSRASGLRSVSEFVEKPSPAVARMLIARGGVWNSFIFAARGRTLLRAFEQRCRQLALDLWEIVSSPNPLAQADALADLYDRAPALDFSRDILQCSPELLRVLTVPPCGWSDLGTPRRVSEALHRFPPRQVRTRKARDAAFLDLTQHRPVTIKGELRTG
ncbi:sugar phosphate nucleotidyltransferase [Peristeroidobacter soli]|uniref:sugar phosphate nucleotidyltransferase n=1 Tax=Peristeroidobacter soli TaxID=2497877 RepID=UPI00101C8E44|nr:sugar phosphate nucleotidyltransferase [Peristeroidobacter soli]